MTREKEDPVITGTTTVSPAALARIEANAKAFGMTTEAFIAARVAEVINRRLVAEADEWVTGVKG